ncbi:hypothetical protein DL741_24325 [Escherichia coli]|nr:hypothetical protein [Escherichia coli]
MSINIDGRDCCQTGQPSQDVTDGALTIFSSIYFPIRSAVIHRYIHEAGVHYKSVCVNRLLYVAIKPVLVT